jgi:large subunit ribosomal protein L9
MRIILNQDIDNVGMASEIKEVKDGYARNYLIPQGMARVATPAAIAEAKRQEGLRRKQEKRDRIEAGDFAARLAEINLTIKAKVGEQHRLFGSVTAADIAGALAEAHEINIDRRKIMMGDPLRSVGVHNVTVHLAPELNADLTVTIEPE